MVFSCSDSLKEENSNSHPLMRRIISEKISKLFTDPLRLRFTPELIIIIKILVR